MYEQFLLAELITCYEVDAGEVHTMDAGWMYLAYVSPNLEAADKINNAFRVRVEKRAPEENQAINSALQVIVVPSSHRKLYGSGKHPRFQMTITCFDLCSYSVVLLNLN